jgi:hypothetical protein
MKKTSKNKSSKHKSSSSNTITNKKCGTIKIDIMIVSIIIVFLIILLLSKMSNINELYNKNPKIIKSNTNIESFVDPKEYNTPREFELYKIDNDLNEITFIFSTPTPHIIGNQVNEYMLILNSYIDQNDSNDNTQKLLDTKLIIKKKEDLKSNDVNLLRKGKLSFIIDSPPKEYISYDDNSSNDNIDDNNTNYLIKEQSSPITYKVGLVAKYPNMYSKAVLCNNIMNSQFTLDNNFNYLENDLSMRLSSEYGIKENQKSNPSINDELDDSLEIPEELSTNAKYEQIKEQLGGYPTNLILEEHTGVNSLDHFLKLPPDQRNIQLNLNLKDEKPNNPL